MPQWLQYYFLHFMIRERFLLTEMLLIHFCSVLFLVRLVIPRILVLILHSMTWFCIESE